MSIRRTIVSIFTGTQQAVDAVKQVRDGAILAVIETYNDRRMKLALCWRRRAGSGCLNGARTGKLLQEGVNDNAKMSELR